MGLKRLFIDIPALLESRVNPESIECEYMFHRENKGAFSLLEIAQFAAYCRQCPDAFCVTACPKDALEHQDDGTIKRYNMRCVGCKSCIMACPFGTIFPEVINYISAKCDYCLNQLNHNPDYVPLCVKTAPDNTIQMIYISEEDPQNHIYFYGEHLAVKNYSWRQKEAKV
ncbi:MAG: 4Fe-4S ferredoxin [Caldithrix sp.]|nr:4Fe-4S ferredoxin [Caldithrix sp.]